jgi:hypothetical protein
MDHGRGRRATSRQYIHFRRFPNRWPRVLPKQKGPVHRRAMLWVLLMTYYKSKAAAQALADELTNQDRDAWRYEVHAAARGFYVAVFDDDGHFLGNL